MSTLRMAWRWSTAGFFSYLSWVLVNLVLAVLFPLFALLRRVGAKEGVRLFAVAFLRLYFLRGLPLFGLYRVNKRSQFDGMRAIQRGLVVINHTSWLDALIIISLVSNVRPLVSTRYGRVPLVSHMMRWLGCIFIDRTDRDSVSAAIRTIRATLERGTPVAVFPEGARSELGHLKPFQEVFFSLAVEMRCEVEPVVLQFDIPFLGPGMQSMVTPRTADLTILKLDTIIPESKERGRDLAFRTRRMMKRAIAALSKDEERRHAQG